MSEDGHELLDREDCPPESGGQRDRDADPARGGSEAVSLKHGRSGTTPALRATPPDSGGEFSRFQNIYNFLLLRAPLTIGCGADVCWESSGPRDIS